MACPRPGNDAVQAVILAASRAGLNLREEDVELLPPEKTGGDYWCARATTPDGKVIAEVQFRPIG